HVIKDEKYEVIRVFKADNVTIQAVKAVEINNVPNESELPFEYKDGRIYVSHEAFKKLDTVDVNLSVEYGKGEFSLVYASYPSFNDLYQ
ncbi:glycosyltransferase family 2 protein, partial [Staphylococcus caprae]